MKYYDNDLYQIIFFSTLKINYIVQTTDAPLFQKKNKFIHSRKARKRFRRTFLLCIRAFARIQNSDRIKYKVRSNFFFRLVPREWFPNDIVVGNETR